MQDAKCTAPGLDGWSTSEWALLNNTAYGWLAALLNAIEHGAQWPRQTCEAKAAFLANSSPPSHSVLDYRILLVLSTFYRRWVQ
eukprot:13312105-Alexandrium_andersonii.AAC.1